MAQIEFYKNVTIEQTTFMAGTVVEEKKLGGGVADLKKRKLIGPVTAETRKALKAAADLEKAEEPKKPKDKE